MEKSKQANADLHHDGYPREIKALGEDDAGNPYGLVYGLIDPNNPNVTPRIALELRGGLQQVLRFKSRAIGRLSHWPDQPEGIPDYTIQSLGILVGMSQIVIWARQLWNVASSGLDAFVGTIPTPDQVSVSSQFWCWEDGGVVIHPDSPEGEMLGLDVTCGLQSIIISPCQIRSDEEMLKQPKQERTGFTGVLVLSPLTTDAHPQLDDILPRLRLLPPLYIDREVQSINAILLASRRFMDLPFISLEPLREPLSRQQRRHMQRKNIPIPEVMTIVLRRKERPDSDRRRGTGVERNWSCQWTVGWPFGKWRRQWFPSEGVHRPGWVRPYIKGPDGLPLRQPRESVYKVSR